MTEASSDKERASNFQQPQGILRHILPQYDEVALFAMSLTCVLLSMVGLFSTGWNIQSYISPFDLHGDESVKLFLGILLFLAGLVLSIYYAVDVRPKSSLEKHLMLFFAVMVNGFSGLFGGLYALDKATGWLVVFPILNVINGVVLLLLLRAGVLNEANISDENASRFQIALTGTAVLTLFVVCHYAFELIWVQTLSICVVYATNIGRRVQLLLWWAISKKETA